MAEGPVSVEAAPGGRFGPPDAAAEVAEAAAAGGPAQRVEFQVSAEAAKGAWRAVLRA